MLTANDIMTGDLTTIRPDAAIEDAIELLLDREISGLPVTDEHGHLVGVITEFALLAMVYDQQVKNHTVEQHMTRELITVNHDDPISRVADLCIVHRVRRLPVMKHGRLVGIIARRDVLKVLRSCPTACLA
jgi:CBS domain-containing protein